MNTNSQVDILAFLDYLSSKGLMNAATVGARKAALRTLLSVLGDDETADVTTLDLDEVARRFLNKRGSEFKPDSVKVYKSRVASAIEDFKKYRADPLNFKSAVAVKSPVRSKAGSPQPKDAPSQQESGPTAHTAPFVSPSEIVFPIPIRANAVVKIIGLPSDLTRQEATKIANVIHALAIMDDT